MALSKIIITNTDEGNTIEALFNPKEYTISKTTSWVEHKTKGKDSPFVNFSSGGRRSLKMDLFFDTSITKENVSDYVKELESLMLMMDKEDKKRPPILFVSWGEKSLHFKCVLEDISQKYTMFTDKGTPVRAMVSVTFKEINEKQTRRFGGTPRRQTRTVRDRENIFCVCSPTPEGHRNWRESATQNNIDDPSHIPAGTQMSMPPE
jgi:hypothetical protein